MKLSLKQRLAAGLSGRDGLPRATPRLPSRPVESAAVNAWLRYCDGQMDAKFVRLTGWLAQDDLRRPIGLEGVPLP